MQIEDFMQENRTGEFSGQLLAADTMVCLYVIISAWVVVMIQTRSFFIGSMSLFGVLLAVPAAISFYNVVLMVKWMNPLNMLTVFLVLGLGCDDIFIMCDA